MPAADGAVPHRAVRPHVTARTTEAGVIARSTALGEAALARTMNAA